MGKVEGLEKRVEYLEKDIKKIRRRTSWLIFWIIVLFVGLNNVS